MPSYSPPCLTASMGGWRGSSKAPRVSAPAGAITVLLPVYVHFLGISTPAFMVPITLAYTLAIAFLMVSRLPVYSGKKVGKRVPPATAGGASTPSNSHVLPFERGGERPTSR